MSGTSPIQTSEHIFIKEDVGTPQPIASPNVNAEFDSQSNTYTNPRTYTQTDKNAMAANDREERSERSSSQDSLLGGSRRFSTRKPQDDTYSPTPKKKYAQKPGLRVRKEKTPLMKNDKTAKRAVIKEIESFWGKGFIRGYIPQCHRPLVKRPAGTSRNIPRFPENNAMMWKPSVLKAVRSLAEKSQEKDRIRNLISEVVRFRNKNTGNKKPELVTTDFDVIEDVFDRGWTVPQAFNIRYKHLTKGKAPEAGRPDDDDDDEDEDMDEEEDIVDAEINVQDEEMVSDDEDDFEFDEDARDHGRRQPAGLKATSKERLRALGQKPLPAYRYGHGGRGAQRMTPASSYESEENVRISRGRGNMRSSFGAGGPFGRARNESAGPGISRLRMQSSATPSLSRKIKPEPVEEEEDGPGDLGMVGEEDEEYLAAQLAVAEANARRAQLNLQLMKKRRQQK